MRESGLFWEIKIPALEVILYRQSEPWSWHTVKKFLVQFPTTIKEQQKKFTLEWRDNLDGENKVGIHSTAFLNNPLWDFEVEFHWD